MPNTIHKLYIIEHTVLYLFRERDKYKPNQTASNENRTHNLSLTRGMLYH